MDLIHCAKCGRSLTIEQTSSPCPDCGSTDRKNATCDQGRGKEQATKDEVAKELAKKHFQLEAGLSRIFRLKGAADIELKPSEPIKLLEVNAATAPTGVMPLHFGPAPASGIPYPSVIIEITPDEFEKIQLKELQLPEGWAIDEEFAKSVDGDGED